MQSYFWPRAFAKTLKSDITSSGKINVLSRKRIPEQNLHCFYGEPCSLIEESPSMPSETGLNTFISYFRYK